MQIDWMKYLESDLVRDLAFVATVGCAAVCLHYAARFRYTMPCVCLSIALMGMAWAVLVPYYESPSGVELLNAFSGLLMVLSGAILRLHVRGLEAQLDPGRHDNWGLRLLYLLLVPHFVELPYGSNLRWFKPVFHAWLGTVILLIGFYSVCHGIRRLTPTSKLLRIPIIVVATIYACLEVSYSVRYSGEYKREYQECETEEKSAAFIRDQQSRVAGMPYQKPVDRSDALKERDMVNLAGSRVRMPGLFRVFFTLLKVAFTATFIVTVIKATTGKGASPRIASPPVPSTA